MFEFESDIVENLLNQNEGFKRLHDKHSDLKRQVYDANVGVISVDNFSLENLKKQKLLLKDKMAAIIASYCQAHV